MHLNLMLDEQSKNPISAKKVVVKVPMMKMRTKKMEKENMNLRKNPPREIIPVIRMNFARAFPYS